MPHSGPVRRPRLAARVAGWWVGATVLSSALALALGGPAAAVAVAAVALAAGGLARAGWYRDVAAFDTLVDGVDELSTGTPLPDGLRSDAGRVARAITRYASGQQRAQALIAAAQERTRVVLDAAPNGVAVIGADGHIELVNASMRRLLELSRDPTGLLPVEALPSVELLEAIDAASRGTSLKPCDFVRGDVDLEASAHPMADGVLALVRDVTPERRVERARTDFVANVSHELRTPIAAILGYAETLLDTPELDPDVAHMARVIHRNGTRLSRLFEDLLALYKIEARRRELPMEVFILAPVLAEAVGPAADAATAKDLAFKLTCADGMTAFGNPQAVAAIVGNLASNACKYTPSGGMVEVIGEQVADGVVVHVRDTGVGIPRAHQERVFERFYRVDEGRAREVGGTGLGLAIAKHLAQATGARISLASEEGHGSTFTLHLKAPAPGRGPRTWDATLQG